MGSSKTHPHIDQPSEEELQRLTEGKSPDIRELYISVHRLVLEVAPDVRYAVDCKDGEIGYGARQYGYDGWGMAGLAPHTKWVTLMFLRGVKLPDPDGLLEGTSSSMRHVKIRSLEEFAARRDYIKRLLQAAVSLNQ